MMNNNRKRSFEVSNEGETFVDDTTRAIPNPPGERRRILTESELTEVGFYGLSDGQKAIFRLVVSGRESVALLGGGGAGKSHLLGAIKLGLSYALSDQMAGGVAVTASTGCAAANIEGMTLHSWAGLPTPLPQVEKVIEEVKRRDSAVQRWLAAGVLVIDEVSMLGDVTFDAIDAVARAIRGVDEPFGGIQVIVSGDFLQLPPVSKDKSRPVRYAFEGIHWESSIPRVCLLEGNIRQEKDEELAEHLAKLRRGVLTPDAERFFDTLKRPLNVSKDTAVVDLVAKTSTAHEINTAHLGKLSGTRHIFLARDPPHPAFDSGPSSSNQHHPSAPISRRPSTKARDKEDIPVGAQLQLVVGAQVMLVRNMTGSLVNGTPGRVVGFGAEDACRQNGAPSWTPLEADAEVGLELGGNKTVKHQIANEDLDKRNTLYNYWTKPEVSSVLWPVVDFTTNDGIQRVLVKPCMFEVKDLLGHVVDQRIQLPLILAWAITIHKAQGRTIPYVRIHTREIFCEGQAYVALSRVRHRDCVQIIGGRLKGKVMVNQTVLKWLDKIKSRPSTIVFGGVGGAAVPMALPVVPSRAGASSRCGNFLSQ